MALSENLWPVVNAAGLCFGAAGIATGVGTMITWPALRLIHPMEFLGLLFMLNIAAFGVLFLGLLFGVKQITSGTVLSLLGVIFAAYASAALMFPRGLAVSCILVA